MVEECLQLDKSGTKCLRAPAAFPYSLTPTLVSIILSVVGLLFIAAAILWTILRHKEKKLQRPHDAEANREKRQTEKAGPSGKGRATVKTT
jgi:hypothetical protein